MTPLAFASDPTLYGGKATGLCTLVRAGLPVPPGVALSWRDEMAPAVRYTLLDTMVVIAPRGTRWAVRSSAVGEDGSAASFAGQHDSLLRVEAHAVPDAVDRVRASLRTPRAVAYRLGKGLPPEGRMGVVVQAMVQPVTHSAVVFTRDPMDGSDVCVVECTPGLGDRLVGGQVTPTQVIVPREGPVVDNPDTPDVPDITALVTLAQRAEGAVGCPVDVEAAYDGARWWLCQARPITTLGGAP